MSYNLIGPKVDKGGASPPTLLKPMELMCVVALHNLCIFSYM